MSAVSSFSTPHFVKSLVLEWYTESKREKWMRQSAELAPLSLLDNKSPLWPRVMRHSHWAWVYDEDENVIYYEVKR